MKHPNLTKMCSLLLVLFLGSAALPDQTLAQAPYTWGYNGRGELGDGTYADRNVPKKLTAPTGTATVAGGGYHSFAVKTDGMLWAWGQNDYGQLGNGQWGTGTNTYSNIPIQVSGITGVVQVSASAFHSLALKSDGTVWAWGYNGNGQLGIGAYDNRLHDSNIPVQVSGLTGVVQVAANGYHSIAVKSDGTVWAWGYNYYGQLGDGTWKNSPTPVQVSGLTGVVQASAGAYHSLALKSDGTVWAWGYNGQGQFGDGTNDRYSNVPVQASALTGVTQIAAGGYHSVALSSNGTVWAWGNNYYGVLGNGTNTDSYYPVQVANITNAALISAVGYHTLALTSDGNLWSWGYNGYGQLGNGTYTDSNVPVLSGVQGMTVISGGGYHTIAIGTSSTTTVTVPDQTYPFGATHLFAKVTLDDTGFPLVQRKVTFWVDGVAVGNSYTDASGTASIWSMVAVGTHKLAVTAPASGTMAAGNGEATLIVTKATTPLVSITLSPSTVLGGKTVTGTVKLSKVAPTDGWMVTLSSDNPVATVPPSVLVPAGATSARFTIVTALSDVVTRANISANFGGATKTAPLTVNPIALVSLTLNPSEVYGGTSVKANVSLNEVAPAGGKVVMLSSNSVFALCPTSVVVPAGKKSVAFKITTTNPTTTTSVDISATLGDVNIHAPLTVNHAIATKLSVAFLPLASRYARGTVITLLATLLDDTGVPVVGKTVTLKEYVSATGTRTTLGSFTTDASGQVQMQYTVPTDPSKDNVYIEAYFVGEGAYRPASKASKRIPIGI